MEEILIDTDQSRLLSEIQEHFLTSLEVIFLSSSALKNISQTNLFAFFEITAYYNQRRLTFSSREVDPCYTLMKEIAFYGCLKTFLILACVFSEFNQSLPTSTVSSLLTSLTQYLRTASIYRNTRNYMMFIHQSLGYIAKSLPRNLLSHATEIIELQDMIGRWTQPTYMPDVVRQPYPYKSSIVQLVLADLQTYGKTMSIEMTSPAEETVARHIANVNISLTEWFRSEKDLTAVHNAIMEGGHMLLQDALNVADRSMLNNWIQQMSFSK